MEKGNMKDYLNINFELIDKMTEIKKNYIEGAVDVETTRNLIRETFKGKKITPAEFAYSEQKIKDLGFDDATVHDKMNDVLDLFDEIIIREESDLPEGHPIKTYLKENEAGKKLIAEMKEEANKKFIKNKWLEYYDKLYTFNLTHLARKQHQLFSILETKGFDRPSRIMWTFDNAVRDNISEARKLLQEDKIDEFLKKQEIVWELTLDIMHKEEEILYPTSLKMITEEEFRNMRSGDDEIGYFLIEKPEGFLPLKKEEKLEKTENTEAAQTGNFMSDLAGLLSKYNMNGNSGKSDVLDVKQGKLTLEQINLIFQHMPVDLSFVDENEIVKFYTDTKHRIFPRSAGVIGRDVKNCHPRESVSSVLEIIEAFRSGEQDEVDFWLEMNGKFIYIYYVAVRDENGKFKGVLEMMQDVTRIRGLEGKRTLVTWERPKKSDIKTEETKNSEKNEQKENPYGLTENTVIGEIIDKYPYIKEFMPTLSPTYKKLLDPIQYMIMSKVATLDMIAMRGGFPVEEIIEKISEKIKSEENEK